MTHHINVTHKSGVINAFHNSVTNLLKICRNIRSAIVPQSGKELRELASSFNLYAKCYKITYSEDSAQIGTYHMPLFEEMLKSLSELFNNYDTNNDDWITKGNLKIIYGSNRGEKSEKVSLNISKFYILAKKIDAKSKNTKESDAKSKNTKESDDEDENIELDMAQELIISVLKVFNACPCRRELGLEGKLLEVLSNYDDFDDNDSESSEDNMAKTVNKTLSQMDNPELVGNIGSTIQNIFKNLNLPVNPGDQTQAQAVVTKSPPFSE